MYSADDFDQLVRVHDSGFDARVGELSICETLVRLRSGPSLKVALPLELVKTPPQIHKPGSQSQIIYDSFTACCPIHSQFMKEKRIPLTHHSSVRGNHYRAIRQLFCAFRLAFRAASAFASAIPSSVDLTSASTPARNT